MTVHDWVNALERIAPRDGAESWDNVGLLVGDRSSKVTRCLLTIDYTPAVAEEARELGCDSIAAYHPPIFAPMKRVLAEGSTELVFDAIRRGVAIYSPHTAWDAVEGGTNDVLADGLGLLDRRPLRGKSGESRDYKLVTFAPVDAVDRVSKALFDSGAGRIGEYSRCSFQSKGTGTFQGSDKTSPAVGSAGKFEAVDEIRIETLVPIAKVSAVIAALRESHPYEEPAFDLQTLAAPPTTQGIGRIGKTPGDATAEMLVNLLKRSLNLDHLLLAGDSQKLIRTVAICAGAGGEMLDDALKANADLYLTGEIRHHDALRAVRAGMVVVCALHSNTERCSLARLAERIRAELPALDVRISQVDRDPFVIA